MTAGSFRLRELEQKQTENEEARTQAAFFVAFLAFSKVNFFPGQPSNRGVNERIHNQPAETSQNTPALKAKQSASRPRSRHPVLGGRNVSRRVGPRRLFTLASNSAPSVSPTEVTSVYRRKSGWIRHET